MRIFKLSSLISACLAIVIAVSACSKSANAERDTEIFSSIDGDEYLKLVSDNSCELGSGGTAVMGTYTKDRNSFRIIVPAMGTSQVIYFDPGSEGLVRRDSGSNLMTLDNACIAHARRISLACYKYALAHNDIPPADLSFLVPDYLPSTRYLRWPLSLNTEEISYYCWPASLAGNPSRILLRSKYENREGKNLIATYASDFKFLAPEEIHKRLDQDAAQK